MSVACTRISPMGNWHVLSAGFLTKVYLDGLTKRSQNANTLLGSIGLRAYMFAGTACNWIGEGLIENLNKRGAHTCYWVINDNDEIIKIRSKSAC